MLNLMLRFPVNWQTFSNGFLQNGKPAQGWYQLVDVTMVSVVFPEVYEGGGGTKGYILQIGMTEKHAKTLELTEFEFAAF